MKLYVSTYAKYNNGSLKGAWLDLDKYRDANEFYRACKELHRDERDPELMFQDVETDPGCDWQEGLYSESSIPGDYWTLKAEFAAHDAQIAKAKDSEQERLCDLYTDSREGCRDGNVKHVKNWNYWRKYYHSRYYFVQLSDGFVEAIEKPSIQTRFCCGEDDRGQGGDGYGTMAYAIRSNAEKRTEAGFKNANLGEFDRRMVHIVGRRAWRLAKTGGEGADAWRDFVPGIIRGALTNGRQYFGNAANLSRSETVVRILNDEDMRQLRRGYMVVREAFRRRLNAYWKRFGASKIHTWTYWTEA